jgi:hypothetical protein
MVKINQLLNKQSKTARHEMKHVTDKGRTKKRI